MSVRAGSQGKHEPALAEASVYPGYDIWGSSEDADAVCDEQMAVISRMIRARYESGHPFFTQTALQDFRRQLRNAVLGGTVCVTGLDGALVEFQIETGRASPIGRSDLERVLQHFPIEGLVTPSEAYPCIPCLAYCNLRIKYQRKVRNKSSNEFLAASLPPYDDVKSYFDRVQDNWTKSQACMRLKAIVESTRTQCSKVIGFALGSISWKLHGSAPQRFALQHALLLSIQHALCFGQSDQSIPLCFAQDPVYTEVDKSLLADRGMTTAHDIDGFPQFDNTSVLVSCSPDVPIKEVVCELALPVLIIWDTIKDNTPGMPTTDPDSPQVKKMLRTNYDRVEFPGEHIYFGNLSVYVRRW